MKTFLRFSLALLIALAQVSCPSSDSSSDSDNGFKGGSMSGDSSNNPANDSAIGGDSMYWAPPESVVFSGAVYELGDDGSLSPVEGVEVEVVYEPMQDYGIEYGGGYGIDDIMPMKPSSSDGAQLGEVAGEDPAAPPDYGDVTTTDDNVGSGTTTGGTDTGWIVTTESVSLGFTDSEGFIFGMVPGSYYGGMKVLTPGYTSVFTQVDLYDDVSAYVVVQKASEDTVELTPTSAKAGPSKTAQRVPLSGGDAWLTADDWDVTSVVTCSVTAYKAAAVVPGINDYYFSVSQIPVAGADVSLTSVATGKTVQSSSSGFSGVSYPGVSTAFEGFDIASLYSMQEAGAVSFSLWYHTTYSGMSGGVDNVWYEAGDALLAYDAGSGLYSFGPVDGVSVPALCPFVFVAKDLQMPQTVVTGNIYGPNSHPLSGALVFCEGALMQSGYEGEFWLSPVVPVTDNYIQVTVLKKGYESETKSIKIPVGEDTVSVDFTLGVEGDTGLVGILGKVVDSVTGLPVEGAQVTVWTGVVPVIGDDGSSAKTSAVSGTVMNKLTVNGDAPLRTISAEYYPEVTYTWEFRKRGGTDWIVASEGQNPMSASISETEIMSAVKDSMGGGNYCGMFDLQVVAVHADGFTESAVGHFTINLKDVVHQSSTALAGDAAIDVNGGWADNYYSALPVEYDTEYYYNYDQGDGTEPMPMPMPYPDENWGTIGEPDTMESGGSTGSGDSSSGSTGGGYDGVGYDTSMDMDLVAPVDAGDGSGGSSGSDPGMVEPGYPGSDMPYWMYNTYSIEWGVRIGSDATGEELFDGKLAVSGVIYPKMVINCIEDNFGELSGLYDADVDSVPETSYLEGGVTATIYLTATYYLLGEKVEKTADVFAEAFASAPNDAVEIGEFGMDSVLIGGFSADPTAVTGADGGFVIIVNGVYDGYIMIKAEAAGYAAGADIALPESDGGNLEQDLQLVPAE